MKDITDITVLLDRSGSMKNIEDDTVGGFNEFVDTQKKTPGDAAISLIGFDDAYEQWWSSIDVKEAPKLTKDTFVPRGWTALYDALGRAINETGARLASLPESARPMKVVFVVITDGMENHSRKFDERMIADMIREQRDKYSWEFMFLGANQDSWASASKIGFERDRVINYGANSGGTRQVFRAGGQSVGNFKAGLCGATAFSSVDYAEADKFIDDEKLKNVRKDARKPRDNS